MSQPSPVSLSKRFIKVESRARTGSDPTPRVQRAGAGKVVIKVTSPTSNSEAPYVEGGEKCQEYAPHTWRKQCVRCGRSREAHNPDVDPISMLPLLEGLTLQNGHPRGREQAVRNKYTWCPQAAGADLIERYFSSLPKECVPLKGSEGAKWRVLAFFRQWPAHDSSLEACHSMEDIEQKRMTKFVTRRKRKFFGIGEVHLLISQDNKLCFRCSEVVAQGSVFVAATLANAQEDRVWHPQCFKCATCKELLVDLLYCYDPDKNRIYCGRHHGDLLVPRCAGCDELIYASTLTESEGLSWHKMHLCCSLCDTQLHGTKFRREGDIMVCDSCFVKTAAHTCQKCKEPIGIGQKLVTHKDLHWHDNCFTCKRCRDDLRGERFFLLHGDLHCADCMEPVAQCHGCKSGISPAVSYLQHSGRAWHAQCFKCTMCQTWLADGQFHELDDNLTCNKCYIDKVCTRCSSCDKPIVGKGVHFSLKYFHPHCFVCTKCKKEFTSEKVKEKNGDPYCQDCIFVMANKCFKCHQPITSKHTLYKNRPFHLECFTCNTCGTSVATSEFFDTNLGQILCNRCVELK